MLIRDKASMTSTRREMPNGFIIVDAVLARTGLQTYSRGELGDQVPEEWRDKPAHTPIRAWRPEAEVFAPAAVESFSNVVLTDDHPSEDVTPDNSERLARGWVGTPFRDGDLLKAPITFSSRSAITKLKGGKDQLSNGYDTDFDWTAGIIPEGQRDAGMAYDCIQRNIKGNHVALVDAGRCGADCRVLDTAPAKIADCASDKPCNCHGDEAMADPALNKRVIDGFGLVNATDEAFAVIDALTKKAATVADELAKAEGATAAAATTHAEAIAAKDKEISDLTAKLGDTAALDALVAARAKLIIDARQIGGADLVIDGLSDLDIKKAAVTAREGADKVKDKADSFFVGAFDYLAEKAGEEQPNQGGGLRDAFRPDNTPTTHKTNDAKKTSYEDKMANRWKAGTKKKDA